MSGGKSARRKGSVGDREARKAFESVGLTIKTSVGVVGADFTVVLPNGHVLSVEATRDKARCPAANKKNLEKAALGRGYPVAWSRADREDAQITMYAKDWLELIQKLLST